MSVASEGNIGENNVTIPRNEDWPVLALRCGAQACVGEEGEGQGAREKTKLSTKYRPLNVEYMKN